jgi:hypothetical protein
MVGFVVGSFIFTMLACSHMTNDAVWQEQAIEAGVGQYNRMTGEFEFIKMEKK